MNKISLKDIETAVEESGYLMEQELAPLIEVFGYYLTPNYNFMDQDEGVSREIDIHAIGGYKISRGRYDFIFPVILAECKKNETPFVFFTHDHPFKGIESLNDVLLSGVPLEIYDRKFEGLISICDFLKIFKFHHFAQTERISTQFCRIIRTGNKIEAKQEMVYDKIIVPLIKVVNNEINEHNESWVPDPEDDEINLQVYYPLVVLKGELYEWYVGNKNKKPKPVQHIVFLRHYESRAIKGEFKIDIITKDYLNTYLEIINSEITEIKKRMQRNIKRLRAEVKREALEKMKEKRHKKTK